MSAGLDGLPGGWVATNLAAVGELVTGMTPSTKDAGFHGGAIPFVKPGDLDGDQPLVRSSDTVTEHGAAQGRILPANTVLVSCIGNLGKTAILGVPAITNQQINAVVPGQGVDPRYLLHLCRTLRPWMDANASATTITILNKGRFGTAPCRLAPINEQKRIVAKIEALQARSDAAKEALDAIPPLLEKFRQSVLAAAFRGDLTKKWREAHPQVEPASELLKRIRTERRRKWQEANPRKQYVEPEPVDTEGLPELPEGWLWFKLEDALPDLRSGCASTAQKEPNDHKVLRSSAVRHGTIDFGDHSFLPDGHGETPANLLKDGDLLFTRLSGSLAYVGNCAVVRGLAGRAIWYPDRLIRAETVQSINKDYIQLAFETKSLRLALEQAAKSTAGHQRISLSDLRRFCLPLPALAEQAEVVRQCGVAFARADEMRTSLALGAAAFGKLNQSILAKAFRGELVPQDPNDEPASVLLERIRREREGGGDKGTVKRGRGRPKAAK